ncbi:MAG: nucleoside deaminase [Acidobacteriota bacterium]
METRHWMDRALSLAEEAARDGDVPVGAVLVCPDGFRVEGKNRGQSESPLAHAEMEVLAAALAARHRNDLRESILYVTLEPCLMCLGAMVHARIGGLVYAAPEPRFGGVAHLQALWKEGRYPHRFPVAGGLMEEEALALLRDFFAARRGGPIPSAP